MVATVRNCLMLYKVLLSLRVMDDPVNRRVIDLGFIRNRVMKRLSVQLDSWNGKFRFRQAFLRESLYFLINSAP